MNEIRRCIVSAMLVGLAICAALAQQPKAGVMGAAEVKKVVPKEYFFRGQSAAVQLRNSAGIQVPDGKMVLAGMVDTSGCSSDLQQKYQGMFITEVKLDIEGSSLAPGAYGFGFTKDGKFIVMDVGANDVLSVSSKTDDKLRRPVPLKIVEEGGMYRLYAGKKWVGLKTQ